MSKTVKFVSIAGQRSVGVPGLGIFEHGEERVLSDDDAKIVLGGSIEHEDGSVESYSRNENFSEVSVAAEVVPVADAEPAPAPASKRSSSQATPSDSKSEA